MFKPVVKSWPKNDFDASFEQRIKRNTSAPLQTAWSVDERLYTFIHGAPDGVI